MSHIHLPHNGSIYLWQHHSHSLQHTATHYYSLQHTKTLSLTCPAKAASPCSTTDKHRFRSVSPEKCCLARVLPCAMWKVCANIKMWKVWKVLLCESLALWNSWESGVQSVCRMCLVVGQYFENMCCAADIDARRTSTKGLYAYIHVYTQMRCNSTKGLYIYVYIYMFINVHICICKYTHMYIMYASTVEVNRYTHRYINIYIRICIHI